MKTALLVGLIARSAAFLSPESASTSTSAVSFVRELGASVSTHGEADALQIERVTRGGAADRAGLQPGAQIVSVDGVPVSTAADLSTWLSDHRPGETIELGILRGGSEVAVTLRLDATTELEDDDGEPGDRPRPREVEKRSVEVKRESADSIEMNYPLAATGGSLIALGYFAPALVAVLTVLLEVSLPLDMQPSSDMLLWTIPLAGPFLYASVHHGSDPTACALYGAAQIGGAVLLVSSFVIGRSSSSGMSPREALLTAGLAMLVTGYGGPLSLYASDVALTGQRTGPPTTDPSRWLIPLVSPLQLKSNAVNEVEVAVLSEALQIGGVVAIIASAFMRGDSSAGMNLAVLPYASTRASGLAISVGF
jgi:hypothetical protein